MQYCKRNMYNFFMPLHFQQVLIAGSKYGTFYFKLKTDDQRQS